MKLKSAITKYVFAFGISAAGLFTGCQPDEFEGGGNGLVSPDLDPSFTITPVTVQGKINTFVFSANHTDNVISQKWDLGDGNATFGPSKTDTLFFPDKDRYKIALTVLGIGGRTYSSTQDLLIEDSDPFAGNLVTGGKFNASDNALWQTVTYNANATISFEGGKVVFRGGSGGHVGLYQPVQITAGQKYKLDMTVTGSGATDTWFEVYVGADAPGAGDYNSGGTRLGLNTWANCGKAAFNDKLTKLACSGSLQGAVGGVVQFPTSGTYYLMIRTGGANLGTTGIAVDNVELRPTL